MKRIGFLTLVLLALAAGPAPARDCRKELSQQSLDPRGWRGVDVVNARGEVVVTPSPDARVHMTALKVACGSTRRREELSRETRVETRLEGGRFVIEVVYPRRNDVRIGFWELLKDFEYPSVEIRLGLQVPRALAVSLRSGSGDLSTEGMTGAQTLKSGSGDILVRDASGRIEITTGSGDVEAEGIGPARVRTGSGDVRIDDVRGPLDARTASGDLTVNGARDSLELECASGDLTVDRAPRGLRASTASGDLEIGPASGRLRLSSSSGHVDVDLAGPFQLGEIGTSSGHVTVRIPDDLGCSLDLESVSGTMSVEVPFELGEVTKRSITGRVGRGAAPLAVRTASGDIEVVAGR